MATLPTDLLGDPTLEAADRALEERNAAGRESRPYLGMSSAGHDCDRRVWSQFRWVGRERLDAVSIRRIEDGFHGEDVQADRLAAVPGLLLVTQRHGGGQLDVGAGHVRGHADGLVLGLRQSPGTWHVWEHKQCAEKSVRQLERFRDELGEKDALMAWNVVYYVQAQLYMLHLGCKRHYLTVSTPGGRRTTSVRTELDRALAEKAMERAERLSLQAEPPPKLEPHARECGWCPFKPHCHEDAMPDRSCRTCVHVTPTKDGSWWCDRHDRRLSVEEQRRGCPDQRLIPGLVPAEQVDANAEENWIEYELPSGERWRDEGDR